MFPQWLCGGPDLDLKVPFSQQVGPQGPFFTCASCLCWLGLSFEPLTAIIGIELVPGAHIEFFFFGHMGLGAVPALQTPLLQAKNFN